MPDAMYPQPTREIAQKRRDRPIDLFALLRHSLNDVIVAAGAVHVPAPVKELDKPHVAFYQLAGKEAIHGKSPVAGFNPIHVQYVLRLFGDVHYFRHRHLHSERHLVLAYPGKYLRVAHFLVGLSVDLVNRFYGLLPHGTFNS